MPRDTVGPLRTRVPSSIVQVCDDYGTALAALALPLDCPAHSASRDRMHHDSTRVVAGVPALSGIPGSGLRSEPRIVRGRSFQRHYG